jgi:molybdenum cofactor cytidylyltransferase
MKHVAALLLAAGGSSRMGRPKQLLRLEGVSLVKRAAQTALLSRCDSLYVVVGAFGDAVREELRGLDLSIVENRFWRTGMGSSIQAGIEALNDGNESYDGVLILLADQPAVDAALLDTIIEKFEEGSSLVASAYAGSIGVPALFSSTFFDSLDELSGDRGAKALLQLHPEEVTKVPFPGGAFDIDTPSDFEHLGSHDLKKGKKTGHRQ